MSELISNALERRGFDPWYSALLASALKRSDGPDEAVALADRVYALAPTENYNPDQLRGKGGRWAKASEGSTASSGAAAGRRTAGMKAVESGKAARVGVPADEVPPPPQIPRLPGLSPRAKEAEGNFISAVNKDPDGVASWFRHVALRSAKPGEPPTFGTDDAKGYTHEWDHPDPETRATNRSTLNLALHQAANAVAKRAFLQHLDTLGKGDEILVTVGGCGAGKGYSLGKVPETIAMKQKSKAVWDSAGDQNATENPWIQKECEKRGLKANYVFVHADPETQWAHPDRGVVKRAGDPKDGRMVDADVFADSYAFGARNHQAFFEKNKSNPNASFAFLSNGAKIDGIPKEALNIDRNKLARFARSVVLSGNAPDRVKKGAVQGVGIWKE